MRWWLHRIWIISPRSCLHAQVQAMIRVRRNEERQLPPQAEEKYEWLLPIFAHPASAAASNMKRCRCRFACLHAYSCRFSHATKQNGASKRKATKKVNRCDNCTYISLSRYFCRSTEWYSRCESSVFVLFETMYIFEARGRVTRMENWK